MAFSFARCGRAATIANLRAFAAAA